MLESRLIPILLIAQGRLVKTISFGERTYVGDPLNTVRLFNDKEVDEIIVLDIDATRYGSGPNLGLVEAIAAEAFMPVAYGGGIGSVDHAAKVMSLGIEKIVVRTAALNRPGLLTDMALEFGSQAVVAAFDVESDGDRYGVVDSDRRFRMGVAEAVGGAADAGAGEVLVQSVQRDGTMSGLDLALASEASGVCPVPLILAGGLSGLDDFGRALEAGVHAVAGGAFFVFRGRRRAVLITYPKRSQILGASRVLPNDEDHGIDFQAH